MKKIFVLGTALLLTSGIVFSQCQTKTADKKECTQKCEKPCCSNDPQECCKDSKECKQTKNSKGSKGSKGSKS